MSCPENRLLSWFVAASGDPLFSALAGRLNCLLECAHPLNIFPDVSCKWLQVFFHTGFLQGHRIFMQRTPRMWFQVFGVMQFKVHSNARLSRAVSENHVVEAVLLLGKESDADDRANLQIERLS